MLRIRRVGTALSPPEPLLERNTVVHRPIALIALFGLAACGGKEFQLYPVSGPLSGVTPPVQITAKASGADEGSGRLTFKLPGKVKCDGTWTAVAPKVVSESSGLSLTLRGGPGAKMGTTTESVPGVNSGEIFALCSDNRRVTGTFVMGSGTTSGRGQAADTMGNTYKILF